MEVCIPGKGLGWGVWTSTSGGMVGGGSALDSGPLRPAGLEARRPRVGYGTSMGPDSPRRSSHLTDRRRRLMILIHYLITGTRIIPTICTRVVIPPSAYDDYESGLSIIREEDKKQWVP